MAQLAAKARLTGYQPGTLPTVDAAGELGDDRFAVLSARLHWSIPDPVRRGTTTAFEDAYAEISRVHHLADLSGDTKAS